MDRKPDGHLALKTSLTHLHSEREETDIECEDRSADDSP